MKGQEEQSHFLLEYAKIVLSVSAILLSSLLVLINADIASPFSIQLRALAVSLCLLFLISVGIIANLTNYKRRQSLAELSLSASDKRRHTQNAERSRKWALLWANIAHILNFSIVSGFAVLIVFFPGIFENNKIKLTEAMNASKALVSAVDIAYSTNTDIKAAYLSKDGYFYCVVIVKSSESGWMVKLDPKLGHAASLRRISELSDSEEYC